MRSAYGWLAALLLIDAGRAYPQETGPWKIIVTPNANPLRVAECSPVRLEVTDAKGVARNAKGTPISMADFDMSVTADRAGAIVGRYDGASAWSACACPGSAGANATITATYPARSLAPDRRMPGVAVRSSVSIPVIAGRSSAVPIGCEVVKTTTVAAGKGAQPWTVTIVPNLRALPIGTCAPVSIDLRDAVGKGGPRNPKGAPVSLADFDLSVTSTQTGAVVGRADNASAWSVCGCQAAQVGTIATITASYPAHVLADAARVAGVAFQSSTTISLTAPAGAANPVGCGSAQPKPAVIAPSSSAAMTAAPPAGKPPTAVAAGAAATTGPAATTAPGAAVGPRGPPIETSLFDPGPLTLAVKLNAHGSWFDPGPVTLTPSLSAHGSWFDPGPVTTTLNLNAHGSWFDPAPMTLTLGLSATGRWIDRTAPPARSRPQER